MADKGMTMQGLGAMAIGILGLIIIFVIIPIVGDQMTTAVVLPGCPYTTNSTGCSVGSNWNSSTFGGSGVPTGLSLWTSLGGILKVAAIVVVIAGFLRTLQGMRS